MSPPTKLPPEMRRKLKSELTYPFGAQSTRTASVVWIGGARVQLHLHLLQRGNPRCPRSARCSDLWLAAGQ